MSAPKIHRRSPGLVVVEDGDDLVLHVGVDELRFEGDAAPFLRGVLAALTGPSTRAALVARLRTADPDLDDELVDQALEMLADAGASESLLAALRGALGARQDCEIRWEAD